jgi:hypothetical protein
MTQALRQRDRSLPVGGAASGAPTAPPRRGKRRPDSAAPARQAAPRQRRPGAACHAPTAPPRCGMPRPDRCAPVRQAAPRQRRPDIELLPTLSYRLCIERVASLDDTLITADTLKDA